MKKFLIMLILIGTLICAIVLIISFAKTTPADTIPADTVPAENTHVADDAVKPFPVSELYYGIVKKIEKSDEGVIVQLWMDSEHHGEYVMNISAETLWIDSGNCVASDSSSMEEGERVYVFHSPISSRSLPPQSAAFVIVRNIPQDASCAQYHEVEEVSLEDGQMKITTSNGGLYIFADDSTDLVSYSADAGITLEDIKVGNYIMAWYETVAASYPGQANATQLMLLP